MEARGGFRISGKRVQIYNGRDEGFDLLIIPLFLNSPIEMNLVSKGEPPLDPPLEAKMRYVASLQGLHCLLSYQT